MIGSTFVSNPLTPPRGASTPTPGTSGLQQQTEASEGDRKSETPLLSRSQDFGHQDTRGSGFQPDSSMGEEDPNVESLHYYKGL